MGEKRKKAVSGSTWNGFDNLRYLLVPNKLRDLTRNMLLYNIVFRIWNITFPYLKPIIIIMTLLAVGGVFLASGFSFMYYTHGSDVLPDWDKDVFYKFTSDDTLKLYLEMAEMGKAGVC